MKEAFLAEKHGLKTAFLGDMTGGVETARIPMNKSNRVTFVCDLASAAADLDVTLRQHDAAASGNSKDLLAQSRYFVKLDGELVFTEKEVVDGKFVDAALNGSAGVVVVEVLAEELDRDANFSHVSAVFALGAVARVASVLAVAHQMKDQPAYSVEF